MRMLVLLAETANVNTYVVKDNQLVRPATLVVANGEEKSLPRNRGDQLLGEEKQQGPADGGEVKVVHLEEKVELERLTVAHELPTAEDDSVVDHQRDNADLECRKGCLSLHEAEVLRLVAGNGFKALFEDWP